MNLLTLSNLYPHPRKPSHGMYNAQLFEQFARQGLDVENWCLIPEFNLLRWPRIARWRSPYPGRVVTRYRPVWYLPVFGRSFAWFTYYLSLCRHIGAETAIDYVYATWLFPDGVAAACLAQRRGVPYGLMVQGSDVAHLRVRARRQVILSTLRRARSVICVSENLRQSLRQAGASGEQVHVVPNGVDGTRFCYRPREEARAALSLQKGVRIILFVGHLWPVKTVDLLIQSVARLRRAGPQGNGGRGGETGVPDWRLEIVGDGPERPALERLVRSLSLGEAVQFRGAANHDAVPAWMNAADVLCLSSRSEGMPNVVLEALVSGLPVVTTDVGCCREILEGEAMARVVTERSPDALASALADLLRDGGDRAGLAARYRGRFSWERQAATILSHMGIVGTPRL